MPEGSSRFPLFSREFTNAFGLAFDSIRAHKLRSFLTLLGVIIGVASVILVGSAIDGLGVYAEESTSKVFGSETFLIAQVASVGRLSRTQYFEKQRQNKQIGLVEERYLESVNGDSTLYSPYRERSDDIKREDAICEDSTIIGVGASMPEIRDINVADGRFFTGEEDRLRSFVAVVGDEVRQTLFPDGISPLDKSVRIDGIDFRVIGVQEKLGSAFGRTQDKTVYIPISAFDRLYGPGRSIAVFGRPRPASNLTLGESLDLARAALRVRFHTLPGKPDNFDSLTPDAIRGFIDSILSMVSAVVVPVTAISLVVGGIVIMNIMLVSVTERTREIGVRKSVGARRSDIMMQILIEAVLMAAMGGAAGVALGAALTEVLSRIFEITLRITAGYVVLALTVSGLVGIVSGWYPAARAARLDPVVALRAE